MTPPRLADRLLNWFVAPHLREEVLGDLHERYTLRVQQWGAAKARRRYWREVLAYMRPSNIKRHPSDYSNPANTDMLRNYLKIAFRNLVKNKVYSFINIFGLATGMAVAMLIGLWIYDELAYNKSFQNYGQIARVMQHLTYNGQIGTQSNLPYPMGDVLRTTYNGDFKRVVMASNTDSHLLTVGDEKFNKIGNFMEPEAPELLSLQMLKGTRAGLTEPGSILLSESVAQAYFGDDDPVGKLMKIDNKLDVKVTGVYEDFPRNSEFRDVSFIAPWKLYLSNEKWVTGMADAWGWNAWYTYVQLADHADIDKISAKIKDVKLTRVSKDDAHYKPVVFLEPMHNWHLYSEFKNGVRSGGLIEYVWLFGTIGLFVLLLACINFMNLSTARSEKRAKEVGIRKAVGSVRSQLVSQFFSESLLVVAFAFVLALVLVKLILPSFNGVADKKLVILWSMPWFWLLGIGFSLLTGLIAGSYPAFYLSSFQPVKVLKGTFKMGRLAAIPRRVLVVVQFTVSVTLIIGTIIVFRQIQFAKNRPVGYNRNGLIMIQTTNGEIHSHFDAVRNDLKNSGDVEEVAESGSPVTDIWSTNGNIDWKGKDPSLAADFPNTGISYEYGKTVGWQFTQGRDFSREFTADSSSFVINEAAVKFMGLKNPVGEIIKWGGHPLKVIGVIKNMIVDSPYQPVRPSLFHLSGSSNFVIIKLNPVKSTSEALVKIETVFKKYNPAAPFDYKFVDDEYAKKFGDEERIGKLATFFAVLAIFISCLGLFGLASFMAEQRTKEIGVRKVLGASVLNLWGLLSKDFVMLVVIGFSVATPIAYYALSDWLQRYSYRTEISWWIFAASGLGALLITLLTVSFQSIKAALMNPVKSLRSE
ncbi:ABC transporter permease [Spirosoma flavum]|uniref:ABC transporter permease n=1 Tax=Spirosoma flavum TaxID=2048557 RepID=A0ABW6AGF8_9BACT